MLPFGVRTFLPPDISYRDDDKATCFGKNKLMLIKTDKYKRLFFFKAAIHGYLCASIMEQFIVSARKYRPTTFKDVVGQQAITNTLENAIANNHLAQALLFTGPRGVGKTTCARILAKRINQDGTEQEDEDFAFNIFELDAASNNSVDDIRNLIEQVRIPPQVGNYKVYIIDEVHMLSSAAFNAFLKTLEEPPRHAVFILATTEKHKIIPTILSRCQIFDFRRIGVNDIKEQLADVASAEGITADDDALHIIAQKADGAMRDALSIFDRVVSFSGKNLTREAVTENLNVLDYTYYFEVTDLLLTNKIPQVLIAYNDILSKGFDGHHFIMGLASHFRDLLVSKHAETISLLEVGDQVKKMYLEQSQKASPSFLIDGIDLANTCDLRYKTSQNQRLLVELCLMQLASLTFQGQKKKSSSLGSKHFVIPPSHFKAEKNISEKTSSDVKPINNNSAGESPNKYPENPIEVVSEKSEISSTEDKNITPKSKIEDIPASNQNNPIPNGLPARNTKRVSALSLKSIQKKHEINQAVNIQEEKVALPVEKFTQEEFLIHWNEYSALVLKQGQFNLHSHLSMEIPEVKGNMVHLQYPNQTIKTEVEYAKYELLGFIREKLKNFEIDLEITVNETVEKRYVYSEKEIYERLREINPLLDKLRIDFQLEL